MWAIFLKTCIRIGEPIIASACDVNDGPQSEPGASPNPTEVAITLAAHIESPYRLTVSQVLGSHLSPEQISSLSRLRIESVYLRDDVVKIELLGERKTK
jgi:hypothetical protein